MRVLILTTGSADDRKTLAAVRSLAAAGAHVTVASNRLDRPVFASRYCSGHLRYPDPARDEAAALAALEAALQSRGYDVMLPLDDYTTFLVSRHRRKFDPHVRTAVPEFETLRHIHDKLNAVAAAARAGLSVPRTFCPRSARELREAAGSLGYPCVLKLRRGAGAVGLRFPRSPRELIACYRSRPGAADPVYDHNRMMIQEYVGGEVHDVGVLFDRGRLCAAFTQRLLGMYPPSGGPGVLNQSTHRPDLVELAERLLGPLGWHGPALVEFKIDPQNDRPVLMEVNGRFWTGLDLAIRAGVDFPLLTCQVAMGRRVESVGAYRVGLRYRWPVPYGLLWAASDGGPLRRLRQYLTRDSSTVSDVRPSDPLPTLMELLHLRRNHRRQAGTAPPANDGVV